MRVTRLEGDNAFQGLSSHHGLNIEVRCESIRQVSHAARFPVESGLIDTSGLISPRV